MRKTTLLLSILLLFLTNFCSGQKINRKAKKSPYLSFVETGNKFVENAYHYQIEKKPDGTFIYKQFYPSTKTLTHYRTYSQQFSSIDGLSKDWFDNGDLWKEGFYKKGIMEGPWKNYYKGKLSSYGHYKAGKMEGVWTHVDSIGSIEATYEYIEGRQSGKFKEFDSLGILINEGFKENGMIISQTHPDTVEQFKIVEKMPMFPGCEKIKSPENQKFCADKAMLQFVYSNIKYPPVARKKGVEGKALIQFVVEKDGSIVDIRPIRGVCKEIEEECLRIVKSFPPWHPGEQDGEPVRVQFNLPVSFRLK